MMAAAAELGLEITSGPYQGLAALDAWTYADLKADIEANGILVSVVVTQDGVIVDGHHRYKIAQELGITDSVPIEVRTYESDTAAQAEALSLNVNRRQMSKAERDRNVTLMRQMNMTQKQIGERLGLSRNRVSEIENLSMSETDKLNSDEVIEAVKAKPRRPGQRLSRAEADAVESKIREMLDAGQPNVAIADAVGLTTSGVSMRIKAMRARQEAPLVEPQPLVEQIAAHAGQGMTSPQIAKRIDLSEETVRRKARENDIDIPADRASYKKRIDADAAMSRAVQHLDDALYAFKFISLADIDQEQVPEWSRSLDESARAIRTLIRQLTKPAKEQDQHDQD